MCVGDDCLIEIGGTHACSTGSTGSRRRGGGGCVGGGPRAWSGGSGFGGDIMCGNDLGYKGWVGSWCAAGAGRLNRRRRLHCVAIATSHTHKRRTPKRLPRMMASMSPMERSAMIRVMLTQVGGICLCGCVGVGGNVGMRSVWPCACLPACLHACIMHAYVFACRSN